MRRLVLPCDVALVVALGVVCVASDAQALKVAPAAPPAAPGQLIGTVGGEQVRVDLAGRWAQLGASGLQVRDGHGVMCFVETVADRAGAPLARFGREALVRSGAKAPATQAVAFEPTTLLGNPAERAFLTLPPKPGAQAHATSAVVTRARGAVWTVRCIGPLAEMAAATLPISQLVAGVAFVNPPRVTAATPSGLATPPGGITYLIDDPAIGVRVRQMRGWRVQVTDDEYTLERAIESPAAVVSLRPLPLAEARRALALVGKARPARFAGVAVIAAERKTAAAEERAFILGQGPLRLVVELRVARREDPTALAARLFELEQALELVARPGGPALLAGRVRVAPPATWRQTRVGPGRANFAGPGGVTAVVRVRPASSDGFVAAEARLRATCSRPGADSAAPIALVGAARGLRLDCGVGARHASVIAQGDAGGPLIEITVDGARAPAAVAEFATYVSLPSLGGKNAPTKDLP